MTGALICHRPCPASPRRRPPAAARPRTPQLAINARRGVTLCAHPAGPERVMDVAAPFRDQRPIDRGDQPGTPHPGWRLARSGSGASAVADPSARRALPASSVTVRRCLPDKLLLRFQLPPRLIEADFARDCLGKSRPANRLGEATSRRKQPFAGLLTKRGSTQTEVPGGTSCSARCQLSFDHLVSKGEQ